MSWLPRGGRAVIAFELEFAPRCVDADRTDRFHQVVEAVHAGLASFAETCDTPDLRVIVVLADDFAGTVDAMLAADAAARGDQHQPFTTDRVGGQVVAKNIPVADDGSAVTVVFNSELHHFDDPSSHAVSILLTAHELTHPIVTRLRAASGALDGVTFPSVTASQHARSIVRCAVDEFRCDIIADIVLGATGTATDDSGTRPLRTSDLFSGVGRRDGLAELLDEHVHPAWPDLVQDYRGWRTPLDQMWSALVTSTDQTFTALAHAEAEAHCAGTAGPVDGPCATHPGVSLYLGPAWRAVIAETARHPLIPELADFAAVEASILDVGERAIFDMWRTLGVTPTATPSGQVHLDVSAPAR